MSEASWRRYLRFWHRDVEGDVDDEIRTHLELRIEDNLARGLSMQEATREAHERFGDVRRVREDCTTIGHERERAMRRAEMLGDFWQDVRYALRTLRSAPGFTLVAVLSLALGIGANTAMFALVDAVVLRPLPGIVRPHELVETSGNPIPWPAVVAMREEGTLFTDVAGFRTRPMSVAIGDDPELRPVGIVSANYFPLLGARPALGRTFLAEEDRRGVRIPVAVLSHALWQRQFAGDRAVLGRTLRLNGQPFTIVGVTEPTFRGTRVIGGAQLWIPVNAWPLTAVGEFADLDIESSGWGWMRAVGRLAPDATVASTQAAVRAFGQRVKERDAELAIAFERMTIAPARTTAVELGSGDPTAAHFVLILAATVAVTLLIACTNVAGLLLARAWRRRREIGVRLALGAGRGRLVRQLLTESLVIAMLGALLGLLVASAAWGLLRHLSLPAGLVPTGGFDGRLLLFTLAVTLTSAVLFGLLPAMQASRPSLTQALRDTGSGLHAVRLRNTLVVAQLALSMLLLVGAGLFVRTLRSTLALETGYDVQRLATARVNLSLQRYDTTRARGFYESLRERLAAAPGVVGVSHALTPPLLDGADTYAFRFPARGADTARRVTLSSNVVDAHFFRTMGIRLARGRTFAPDDFTGPPKSAIVNETMARRFWPGEDAMGQRFALGNTPVEVIGVAADTKYESPLEEPTPFVYLPLNSANPRYADWTSILVRTSGDPDALVPLLRATLRSLDPLAPVNRVSTYEGALADRLTLQRAAAQVLGLFASLTLLLASIGIYGLLAYFVAQRTREIGIRLALGASDGQVMSLVLGRSFRLVAIGLVIGGGLAVLAAAPLGEMLLGIRATDPAALAGSALLLGGAALLASWLPARRAMRIDPTLALRSE